MKENEYINEDDSVCPRDWREIEKEQELKEIFEANFLDGNKMETDACTLSIRGAFDVAEFFYQKGKEEGTVEHCDEPNCPECNLVAYNKGRSQILEEVKSHFHELKSKIDNAFYEMSKEIE